MNETSNVLPPRPPPEPWVTGRQLAEHFAMSERWVRDRKLEGMPHRSSGNRTPYKISACEHWLEDHAKKPRRG